MDFVVELTENAPGLCIKQRLSGFDLGFISWGVTTSTSPNDWTNHQGFFSVIDNEGRCWVYNGRDDVFIYERLPDMGRSWNLNTWPRDIPDVVATKLPQDLLQSAPIYQTKLGVQGVVPNP